MDYKALINKSIKDLRKKLGLTQEQFCEKIGISLQGLSNLERNRYQPTAETIDKICKVFKITPNELLLEPNKESQDIIKNISILLSNCPKTKLKKIYTIIQTLVKM